MRSIQRRNAGRSGSAWLCEFRVEACGNPFHDPPGKANVTVLDERNEIVGHRTAHCVLEVDHAERTVIDHHEIARMVVPVHKHRWLFERGVHEEPRDVFKPCTRGTVELQAKLRSQNHSGNSAISSAAALRHRRTRPHQPTAGHPPRP